MKKSIRQKRRHCTCVRFYCLKTLCGRDFLRWLKAYRFWLFSLILIASCICFPWILKAIIASGDAGWLNKAAQSGDMFGSLNALLTGLAFIGFLYALWMQRQDLNLQRKEMGCQTMQFARQASIAALQTIYAALPTYEKYLSMNWDKITKSGNPIPEVLGRCRTIIEISISIFSADSSCPQSHDNILRLYTLLEELDRKLTSFMQWAQVVFRWADKVDRYIENENDRTDAKRTLVLPLGPNQYCILWLCHLAESKVTKEGIVPYLFQNEFLHVYSDVKVWQQINSEIKDAVENLLREELCAMHRYLQAPSQETTTHTFKDDFEKRIIRRIEEIHRHKCA